MQREGYYVKEEGYFFFFDFFNWFLDRILKGHAKCHQLHHHICLLLGPVMSDWNSRGSWQLKFSCISFTWVATKPWSIAINPVKKIQRVPVVFCGEGHNLNLEEKDTLIQCKRKHEKYTTRKQMYLSKLSSQIIIRPWIKNESTQKIF